MELIASQLEYRTSGRTSSNVAKKACMGQQGQVGPLERMTSIKGNIPMEGKAPNLILSQQIFSSIIQNFFLHFSLLSVSLDSLEASRWKQQIRAVIKSGLCSYQQKHLQKILSLANSGQLLLSQPFEPILLFPPPSLLKTTIWIESRPSTPDQPPVLQLKT